MSDSYTQLTEVPVATREGGVDRNEEYNATVARLKAVATREGGVDRNNLHQLPPF